MVSGTTASGHCRRLQRSIRARREAIPNLLEARTDPQDIGVDFGDLNPGRS
jgi:hypothetical protein